MSALPSAGGKSRGKSQLHPALPWFAPVIRSLLSSVPPRPLFRLAPLLLAILGTGCGEGCGARTPAPALVAATPTPAPSPTPQAWVMLSEGLRYREEKAGTGEALVADGIRPKFALRLMDAKDDRLVWEGELAFEIGAGQALPGLDECVRGMKLGETRLMDVPPSKAYGEAGFAAWKIEPNSALRIEATLLEIRN